MTIEFFLKTILLLAIFILFAWFILISIYPTFFSNESSEIASKGLPKSTLLRLFGSHEEKEEDQTFQNEVYEADSKEINELDSKSSIELNSKPFSPINIVTPSIIEVLSDSKEKLSENDVIIKTAEGTDDQDKDSMQHTSKEMNQLLAQWNDLNAKLKILREITSNSKISTADASNHLQTDNEFDKNDENEELKFIKNFFNGFENNEDTLNRKNSEKHHTKQHKFLGSIDDPIENYQTSDEMQDAGYPVETIFRDLMSSLSLLDHYSEDETIDEGKSFQNNPKEELLSSNIESKLLQATESSVTLADEQDQSTANIMEDSGKVNTNTENTKPAVFDYHIGYRWIHNNESDEITADNNKKSNSSEESTQPDEVLTSIIEALMKIVPDDTAVDNKDGNLAGTENNFENSDLVSDDSALINESKESQNTKDIASLIDSTEVDKDEEMKNMNEFLSFYGDYDY